MPFCRRGGDTAEATGNADHTLSSAFSRTRLHLESHAMSDQPRKRLGRRFRILATLLLALALFLLFKQRFAQSSNGHPDVALSQPSSDVGDAATGLPKLPSTAGSRDVRGELIPLDEGASSFNSYLKQYRSLTSSTTRRVLLNEMVATHGRMFGPQILELIKSFDPPAEVRLVLLRLGMQQASADRSIHAYALTQFPSGKDRSSLIGAALTHYPTESIGSFLALMEDSTVEGDLKETARLIADQHLLGRPQISDEQLQQLTNAVRSPELRAALLTEAAERPKRAQSPPASKTE